MFRGGSHRCQIVTPMLGNSLLPLINEGKISVLREYNRQSYEHIPARPKATVLILRESSFPGHMRVESWPNMVSFALKIGLDRHQAVGGSRYGRGKSFHYEK